MEKASGKADGSPSWSALEKGTQTRPPLPAGAPEESLIQPDRCPDPCPARVCLYVHVYWAGPSSAGRGHTACLSAFPAAIQEVHTDPLGRPPADPGGNHLRRGREDARVLRAAGLLPGGEGVLGCRWGTRGQMCVCAHPDAPFCSLAPSPPWTLAFREVLGSHGPARSPTQELLEEVHLHLVKEYIARLCKRRLVLKTAEQQLQLAGHVQANAQLIQQFCTQNVSTPTPSLPGRGAALLPQALQGLGQPLWASPNLIRPDLSLSGPPGALPGRASLSQRSLCPQGSPATWLHHALPTLAEIIRLQDPSAIKIEVATYATWYPDFR